MQWLTIFYKKPPYITIDISCFANINKLFCSRLSQWSIDWNSHNLPPPLLRLSDLSTCVTSSNRKFGMLDLMVWWFKSLHADLSVNFMFWSVQKKRSMFFIKNTKMKKWKKFVGSRSLQQKACSRKQVEEIMILYMRWGYPTCLAISLGGLVWVS